MKYDINNEKISKPHLLSNEMIVRYEIKCDKMR